MRTKLNAHRAVNSARAIEGRSSLNFGGAGTWLSGITLGLTLLSITLYAAGKAYRSAYLRQFGVSDAILPSTTQDLVYLGAVTQLESLLLSFPRLAAFLAVLTVFNWAGYRVSKALAARIAKSDLMRRLKLRRPSVKRIESDAALPETAFMLRLILTGLILFSIFIVCTLYVANAEKLGTKDGIEDKAAMISGDRKRIAARQIQIVVTQKSGLKNGHPGAVGFAFSCSEKACYVFEKGAPDDSKTSIGDVSGRTRYVPLEQIIEFQHWESLQD